MLAVDPLMQLIIVQIGFMLLKYLITLLTAFGLKANKHPSDIPSGNCAERVFLSRIVTKHMGQGKQIIK